MAMGGGMGAGCAPCNTFVGNKNQAFTYFGNFNDYHGGIITGLKVLWNDAIVGIEFFFNHKPSHMIKGSLAQTWEETFNLSGDDFIVQIFGRVSNVINCFGFKTHKGFTKVWGNPCVGEAFNLALENQYVKSLHIGVSGNYISYLEGVFGDIEFLFAKNVAFLANGKTTEALGRLGVSAEAFDDQNWISDYFNYELQEVKVFHDQQYCYGIQTFYKMDGTRKSPGTHMVFANNIKSDSFILQQDEHITHALIRAGDVIDGISLYTDKGRSFSAGGKGGKTYAIFAPPGMHIVAFNGTLGEKLSRLQAYCNEYY